MTHKTHRIIGTISIILGCWACATGPSRYQEAHSYYSLYRYARAIEAARSVPQDDPNYTKAQDLINLAQSAQGDFFIYQVGTGETWASIAKLFTDEEADALALAEYNNLPPDAPPTVGKTVKIPKSIARLAQARPDRLLAQARKKVDQQDYTGALNVLNIISAIDPAKKREVDQIKRELAEKLDATAMSRYNSGDVEGAIRVWNAVPQDSTPASQVSARMATAKKNLNRLVALTSSSRP